jgi:hypothetical protein
MVCVVVCGGGVMWFVVWWWWWCAGAAVPAADRAIRSHRAAALGPRLRPGAAAQEDGSLLLPAALSTLRQVRLSTRPAVVGVL